MNFPRFFVLQSIYRFLFRVSVSILFTTGLAATSIVSALTPLESPEQYQLPDDLSAVHFYLITVDVGDSVVIRFEGDSGRQYTIFIDKTRHDPDHGIWRSDHPYAQALIGLEEEDIFEINTPEGSKTAAVLGIRKGAREAA